MNDEILIELRCIRKSIEEINDFIMDIYLMQTERDINEAEQRGEVVRVSEDDFKTFENNIIKFPVKNKLLD
jgi:hypothetical protein